MTAPPAPRSAAESTLAAVRRLLLGVFLFGALGTVAELVLLEHYEEPWQLVPLALLGAGAAMAAWRLVRDGAGAARAFRLVMLAYLVAGAVGVLLHYRANHQFELELDPETRGARLLWEALRGGTPSLAPGTMMLLGLVGLAATFGHPAAATRRAP